MSEEHLSQLVIIRRPGDEATLLTDVNDQEADQYQRQILRIIKSRDIIKVTQCLYDIEKKAICAWNLKLYLRDKNGRRSKDTVDNVWVYNDETESKEDQQQFAFQTVSKRFSSKAFKDFYALKLFTDLNGKKLETFSQFQKFIVGHYIANLKIRKISGYIKIDENPTAWQFSDVTVYVQTTDVPISDDFTLNMSSLLRGIEDKLICNHTWQPAYGSKLNDVRAMFIEIGQKPIEMDIAIHPEGKSLNQSAVIIPSRYLANKEAESPDSNESVNMLGTIHIYTTDYDSGPLPNMEPQDHPHGISSEQFTQLQQQIMQPQASQSVALPRQIKHNSPLMLS